MNTSRNRWMSLAIVAGLGIGASSAAMAHVDVGVNIGVPGVVLAAPEPVYAPPPPPPPVYAPAPVVVVNPGWYGDRYYDGHRYWERREWEARHHDPREWHDARGPHGDWRGHDDGRMAVTTTMVAAITDHAHGSVKRPRSRGRAAHAFAPPILQERRIATQRSTTSKRAGRRYAHLRRIQRADRANCVCDRTARYCANGFRRTRGWRLRQWPARGTGARGRATTICSRCCATRWCCCA